MHLTRDRLPTGRVIFEIGGVPIREELAKESMSVFSLLSARVNNIPVLRQAASKLPCQMEFITPKSPPRLGRLLLHPPAPPKLLPVDSIAPETVVPAQLSI